MLCCICFVFLSDFLYEIKNVQSNLVFYRLNKKYLNTKLPKYFDENKSLSKPIYMQKYE